MKNFTNIELLSEYLDGRLNASELSQLEVRLQSDPELDAALQDLRAARNILHRLPARKAPRNFTLTRQMVGLKPPLPRAYPFFKFATAFAAVLFLFSFTVNTLASQGGVAAAPAAYSADQANGEEQEFAAFAAESAPAAPFDEETPSVKMLPPEAPLEPFEPTAAPFNWTALFFILAILGGGALWTMRSAARAKWK